MREDNDDFRVFADDVAAESVKSNKRLKYTQVFPQIKAVMCEEKAQIAVRLVPKNHQKMIKQSEKEFEL